VPVDVAPAHHSLVAVYGKELDAAPSLVLGHEPLQLFERWCLDMNEISALASDGIECAAERREIPLLAAHGSAPRLSRTAL
jgi:hypothetical protein